MNNTIENYQLISSEMLTKDFIDDIYSLLLPGENVLRGLKLRGHFPFSKEVGTFIKVDIQRNCKMIKDYPDEKMIYSEVTRLFNCIHGVYSIPSHSNSFPKLVDKKKCRDDYKNILLQLEGISVPFNFVEDNFFKEVYVKYDFLTIPLDNRPPYTIVLNTLLNKYHTNNYYHRIALEGSDLYESP